MVPTYRGGTDIVWYVLVCTTSFLLSVVQKSHSHKNANAKPSTIFSKKEERIGGGGRVKSYHICCWKESVLKCGER